jgi:hypothetical protein
MNALGEPGEELLTGLQEENAIPDKGQCVGRISVTGSMDAG